ncbi:MAG: SLOG family protein [Actinomycetota bacterium]|nr:SLOG family protein [Actinomycetota bacterium]
MALHELVVEDGELRFHCNAKPQNGTSPPCWYSYECDEAGNEISREDLGECNARLWIDEQEIETEGVVRIPVEVAWGPEGPVLELADGIEDSERFEPCDPVWLEAVPDTPVQYCFVAEGRIIHNRGCHHLVAEIEKPRQPEVGALRILVCGGRDYNDTETIQVVLRKLARRHFGATLVHGCAPGADSWCGYYGGLAGFSIEAHPARWNVYGHKAGPIRNKEMLDSGIDLVVAFPGGRGTADMVRRARRKGVPVWEPDDIGTEIPDVGAMT